MVAKIGMSPAFLNDFLSGNERFSGTLQLLITAVNTIRFGKTASRAVYNIRDNPAAFAAGGLAHIFVGDNTLVKCTAQIALISRSILELYDAHKTLNRAWNNLWTLTNEIPIENVKHACHQKNKIEKSTTRTIILLLPSPFAKTFVKMQDVAHLISQLSQALLNYVSAWDTLYCACFMDSMAQFAANTEIFINIRKTYKRLSENKSELCKLLSTVSEPMDELFKLAQIDHTAKGLIDTFAEKTKPINFMLSKIDVIVSTAKSLLYNTATILLNPIRPLINLSYFDPDPDPIQPTLQPRNNYGHNSSSNTSCKTNTGNSRRRFYKVT